MRTTAGVHRADLLGELVGSTLTIENVFYTALREPWTITTTPPGDHLLPSRLANAASRALGVEAAGISLFDKDIRVPLGASDSNASLAERLQFTQGTGPCLEAVESGHAVYATASRMTDKWPMFAHALSEQTPYRSIQSLPLRFRDVIRGAMDLYFLDDHAGPRIDIVEATVVGNLVVDEIVASLSVDTIQGDNVPGIFNGPGAHRRSAVWVAIGMLTEAFAWSPSDALVRLRAHAYAHARTIDDLADSLVRGATPPTDLAE